MRRNLGLEAGPIANTLNNPRHERSAVQHAHLPRNADVGVDERVVVGDHVLIGGVGGDGVFKRIGGSLE